VLRIETTSVGASEEVISLVSVILNRLSFMNEEDRCY